MTLCDFEGGQNRDPSTIERKRNLCHKAGRLVEESNEKPQRRMGSLGEGKPMMSQQRIDALKRRPAPAEVHPVLFQYDPNKPLSLLQQDRKNRNEK
jgi:hypothetical protein